MIICNHALFFSLQPFSSSHSSFITLLACVYFMLSISCKFSRSRITGLLAARPSSPARDLDLVHEWLTLRSLRLSLMIIFGQVLDPAAHLFVSALPGLVMCVGPADPPLSSLRFSSPAAPCLFLLASAAVVALWTMFLEGRRRRSCVRFCAG